jgi:hypothetical protein
MIWIYGGDLWAGTVCIVKFHVGRNSYLFTEQCLYVPGSW